MTLWDGDEDSLAAARGCFTALLLTALAVATAAVSAGLVWR